MGDSPSRRQFLRIAAASSTGLAIAGCTGGSGSDTSGGGGGDTSGGGGGDTSGGDTGGEENDGNSGSGDGSEWTKTSTVEMNDKLKYAPKRIEVSKGTTVTWKNVGKIGHTVTAYEDEIPGGADYFASGGFDSESAASEGYPDKGNVTAGGTYEHTFETKGEYKYYCIPHEMSGMVGYVKVV